MGKTTIVLDEELLAEAAECAGTATKKDTIEAGLLELIRRSCRKDLKSMLGKEILDLSERELERLREDD